MHTAISNIAAFVPVDLDIVSMVKFIVIFAAAVLGLGLLFRIFFGHRSNLNHAVSSSIGIFFLYAATVLIYTFDPAGCSRFLAPLPLAQINGDLLYLFSFSTAEITSICAQIISMLILAFLVNLLDSLIPKGERILSWLVFRILSVALALFGHYLVTTLFGSFLPELLLEYATVILLAGLVLCLIIGVLNALLSLVLTVANPILGAMYTFFFSTLVGKQVSKSVLTTGILSAVVILLEKFGYQAILISQNSLGNYIPLLAVLGVLWYIIGHKL